MLQQAYDMFKAEVSMGFHCESGCTGRWHLSPVDTWHACSCGNPGPHPEDEEDWLVDPEVLEGLRQTWKNLANRLINNVFFDGERQDILDSAEGKTPDEAVQALRDWEDHLEDLEGRYQDWYEFRHER